MFSIRSEITITKVFNWKRDNNIDNVILIANNNENISLL